MSKEPPLPDAQEPFVTIEQATEHFQISRTLLYDMMREGELPFLPVGRRGRRVRISAVETGLVARARKSDIRP